MHKKDILKQIEELRKMVEALPDDEPKQDNKPGVSFTLEDVREKVIEYNKATDYEKAQALLKEFKVTRVRDLTEDKFAAVIKRIDEMLHAK